MIIWLEWNELKTYFCTKGDAQSQCSIVYVGETCEKLMFTSSGGRLTPSKLLHMQDIEVKDGLDLMRCVAKPSLQTLQFL